jgi:polar amino acid transport system permease protein
MNWQEHLPALLRGLTRSMWIAAISSVLALLLGASIASARVLCSRWVAVPLRAVVTLIRNTPLLVQIFIGFYVLPEIGIVIPAIRVGIAVLSIHFATYCSEAIYSSVRAVPIGQWEAGRAVNLRERAILLRIVMPQAVKSAAAPLTNYSLSLFKDTAILSVITVQELLGATRGAAISTFSFIPLYTVMGLLYLSVSLPGATLARRLERRFA